MKILILTNEFSERGGADIAAARQADIFVKYGWHVSMFTYLNKRAHADKNFTIHSVQQKYRKRRNNLFEFFYSFKSRNFVNGLLASNSFDLAIVHLVKGGLTVSVLRELKRANVPIVRVLHDYELLDPHNRLLTGANKVSLRSAKFSFYAVTDRHNRNSYVLSFASWLDYLVTKFMFPYSNYSRLIHVSDFSLNLHRRFLPHLNGQTIRNFAPIPPAIPEIKKEFDFIYFGRLSKEKGISTLVSAFSQIKNISISLVGSIPSEWKDELHDNIHWLGSIKNEDLLKLLPKYKFAVLPAEWFENNPLSIIEAFSCGVPCIGSDIGGIPEMIGHKETGYLFKAGSVDRLKEVVEHAYQMDELSYKQMQKNCIEKARIDYGMVKYIREWERILRSVYERE